MLWQMHGRPDNQLHWLGYSFAPALVCLIAGQTTLFALLGFVLFLRLQKTQPFLAGAALWLCALKPHLFLPFGLVLMVWIVIARCYRLLAGAFVAMSLSWATIYLIDPMAWGQYSQMMRLSGIQNEFIPCVSVVLRLWTSPRMTWIQYAPSALCCAWALIYFWNRRHSWNWITDGSLIMLASIVFAPYCWLFDQVLAIPAILDGAYRAQFKSVSAAVALASLLIEIELVRNVNLPSVLFLWTAPAWLAWYLISRSSITRSRMHEESV
jgi:hypothetical protein